MDFSSTSVIEKSMFLTQVIFTKEKLNKALQLNPKKSVLFLQWYPEFKNIQWIHDSIKTNTEAST